MYPGFRISCIGWTMPIAVDVVFLVQRANQLLQVRLNFTCLFNRSAVGKKQIADELVSIRLREEIAGNQPRDQQHDRAEKERVRHTDSQPSGFYAQHTEMEIRTSGCR